MIIASFFLLAMNYSHSGWYDEEKKPKTIHVCVDSNGTKHFSDFGCPVEKDKIKEDYYIREIKKDTVGFEKIDIQREREARKERERDARESKYSSFRSTISSGCDNSDYLNSTPASIRFANDNPIGTSCYRAVQKVRKLGNDPEYDCKASIRRAWSQAVDYATSLGCTL